MILDEELHWGLNKDSCTNDIGLVVGVQVVQEVSLIVLLNIDSLLSTEHASLHNLVLRSRFVLRAVQIDTIVQFDLEELHIRLFNSEVGHLNVKSMEVNSSNRFLKVLGEFTLTELIHISVIRKSAGLMEFSEEGVEIISSVIEDESVPVAASSNRAVVVLKLINDLLEVPRES